MRILRDNNLQYALPYGFLLAAAYSACQITINMIALYRVATSDSDQIPWPLSMVVHPFPDLRVLGALYMFGVGLALAARATPLLIASERLAAEAADDLVLVNNFEAAQAEARPSSLPRPRLH